MAVWPRKRGQGRLQISFIYFVFFGLYFFFLPPEMNILFGFSFLDSASQTIYLISFIFYLFLK